MVPININIEKSFDFLRDSLMNRTVPKPTVCFDSEVSEFALWVMASTAATPLKGRRQTPVLYSVPRRKNGPVRLSPITGTSA